MPFSAESAEGETIDPGLLITSCGESLSGFRVEQRSAGATSSEPLKTAVPEAQASLSCVWFQSGEYWLKAGGCLIAAPCSVCGFGMSC